jgi:thiazole/oxazole-forming peptide maturase SagD family component
MRVVLAESRTGGELVRTLGAGHNIEEARKRARMEMVERLSGFFREDEARVRASRRELGRAAIDPNSVLLYSRRQQSLRLADETQVEWSPLWNVTLQQWNYLPTQLLFYRYAPRRAALGRADSNGVAAGRTLQDAAGRALLELVERDSVALWWYNRVRRPRVDLHNASDAFIRRVCAWYRDGGRECWALDLTSDLGIPVVAAVSRRVDGEQEEIVLGFGAHFDRAQATRRALLETGQMLALASAARNGALTLPIAMRRWLKRATVAAHPYLLPSDARAVPLRTARVVADSRDVFRLGRAALEKRGLHVLVADLSRERLGARVARVVVPGLRPWWPRFATGRLYDAPVTAGWLESPTPEAKLNPAPIFF